MSNPLSKLEHVNVKVFAREPVHVNWADLIPVYHRWIQQQVFPDILPIDVADYSHVPAGPGVMLIGHHADISLDNRQNHVGVLYNRRTVLDGSFTDKLRHSYDGAIAAARKLQSEPEFHGRISFDESDVEVFFNDRLAAPNTQATWDALRGEFEAFFGPDAAFSWNGASRELLRVRVDGALQPR